MTPAMIPPRPTDFSDRGGLTGALFPHPGLEGTSQFGLLLQETFRP